MKRAIYYFFDYACGLTGHRLFMCYYRWPRFQRWWLHLTDDDGS